jgi:hypothetical protein
MKTVHRLSLLLLTFAFVSPQCFSQASRNPGFEKMKTLLGEWEGRTQDGGAVRVSYKLVSGGTAVMETLQPPDEPEMVTLYTVDGNRLVMTHYCPTSTQPHMRTAEVDGAPRQLEFSFVDATNLSSPLVGHMQRLSISFDDTKHFTQVWTWRENGKDIPHEFRFGRR